MSDQLLRKAAEAWSTVPEAEHHLYRWKVTKAEFDALEKVAEENRPSGGGYWPAMGPEGAEPTVAPTLFGFVVEVDDTVAEMTLERR